MVLRILKVVEKKNGHPVALREIQAAFLPGGLVGLPELKDEAIEITLTGGRIEASAARLHPTDYSRRRVNAALRDLLQSKGATALDGMSSYSDLADQDCLLWDSEHPVPLNPHEIPKVLNDPGIAAPAAASEAAPAT